MSNLTNVPGALVFATDLDTVTRYNCPAAWEAMYVLQTRDQLPSLSFLPIAKPKHEKSAHESVKCATQYQHDVVPLEGRDAYCSILDRLSESSLVSPQKFVLGFGVAHGSQGGLVSVPGHPLKIDASHLQHFENGILVLAACLGDGQWAQNIVGGDSAIKAVIGYQELLYSPIPYTIRLWGQETYHRFKMQFIKAVVQPLITLLDGKSVSEACEDGKVAWKAIRIATPDGAIKAICNVNRDALTLFGDPNARLVTNSQAT